MTLSCFSNNFTVPYRFFNIYFDPSLMIHPYPRLFPLTLRPVKRKNTAATLTSKMTSYAILPMSFLSLFSRFQKVDNFSTGWQMMGYKAQPIQLRMKGNVTRVEKHILKQSSNFDCDEKNVYIYCYSGCFFPVGR